MQHMQDLSSTGPKLSGLQLPHCLYDTLSCAIPLPAGIRAITLINASLGWRIPFRPHVAVQTISIALLICFGTHSFCSTRVGGWVRLGVWLGARMVAMAKPMTSCCQIPPAPPLRLSHPPPPPILSHPPP